MQSVLASQAEIMIQNSESQASQDILDKTHDETVHALEEALRSPAFGGNDTLENVDVEQIITTYLLDAGRDQHNV